MSITTRMEARKGKTDWNVGSRFGLLMLRTYFQPESGGNYFSRTSKRPFSTEDWLYLSLLPHLEL